MHLYLHTAIVALICILYFLQVFFTLALVDSIQRTLTGFADAVGRLAEAIASTKRIQLVNQLIEIKEL